ncbi:MAG: hypothetical protein M1823_006362, partial [Watsoniomyces obsoletus]
LTPELDILAYWKSKTTIWPQLCRMARDVLAVPATSVGVERLFNMARDVCNYRRGHLKGDTIRSLMMMRHRDATDLEAEIDQDPEVDPFEQNQVKTDIGWALEQDFISDGEGSDDEPFLAVDTFHDDLYDNSDEGRLPERTATRLQRQRTTRQSTATIGGSSTQPALSTSASRKRATGALDRAVAKRAKNSASQL